MSTAAYSEAKALFHLAHLPGWTIEEIRKDIPPDKHSDASTTLLRNRTLKFFDAFVRAGRALRFSELPKEIKSEPKEVRPPSPQSLRRAEILEALRNGGSVLEITQRFGCSDRTVRNIARANRDVRGETIALLKANWPHHKIVKKVPIGYAALWKLSKEIGAAYWKRGRGRRFTPGTREAICAAVLSGRRSCDIEREFQIDASTVRTIRRAHGDFDNRKYWTKVTPEQIAQAEALLRSGEKWLAVAQAVGLGLGTVQRHVTYRKGRKRVTAERRSAIVAALHVGKSQRAIYRELRAHGATVRQIRREEGETHGWPQAVA